MFQLRESHARGQADHGWLKSQHTFSFAGYRDPEQMGFRKLRVINEDRVAPGAGFGTHPHRDMEIISYVLGGAIEHKDSMGNGSVIRPGEVQRMTAGTGVTHSEFNHSKTQDVHFLQIWIMPERNGLKPGYEQKAFAEQERQGQLRLVASRDGRQGSVTVHQDLNLYSSLLSAGDEVPYAIPPGRHAWIQLVQGTLQVGPITMQAGDGLAISDESQLMLTTATTAHFLVFDLS